MNSSDLHLGTVSDDAPDSTHELDPNILQRQASAPETSAWVSASAGSGKTKVLSERIIRLMLPSGAAERNACPPHKILALTFTKAGANEMALRIHKMLGRWALLPDDRLASALEKLLGHPPTPTQLTKARQLFARTLDTPGGMKIMTIHSFCQSILGRFPLEAGVSPNFKALDEVQAQHLLRQARDKVLARAAEEKSTPLSQALYHLSASQNETQFIELIQKAISERRQVRDILKQNFGPDGLYTALCQKMGAPAGCRPEELIYSASQDEAFDFTGLKKAANILAQAPNKTDPKTALLIAAWIAQTPEERIKNWESYKQAFFTREGKRRAKLVTVKWAEKHPDIVQTLEQEFERLEHIEKQCLALDTAALTRDFFVLSEAILNEFEILKSEQDALDFDDLILKTLGLLKGESNNLEGLNVTPWIRFKLDQGVDHILVDEAQDTNPEQWEIIQALCDDFFDGAARENISGNENFNRTLFVVGDKKQSIFSFQRAAPEKFENMKEFFKNKIQSTNRTLHTVDFQTSFRSSSPVLKLVDEVFAPSNMREGLDHTPIQHRAFYHQRAGLVELWPLFENPPLEKRDPWEPPTDIIETRSGAAQMADFIAHQVQEWIGTKWLDSKNRFAGAGDIMILVRSRTSFIPRLVRALKSNNIPVSGVDRMVVNDQLVVEDLCACARIALLPEDDLTLACLLKSPLIGWDEETLYNLAYGRASTLWQALVNSTHKDVIEWIQNLIKLARSATPYEFFTAILHTPCPVNEQSGQHAILSRLGEDALDPLEEFLNTALDFERNNISSLQNFLQHHDHQQTEIKREMEEGGKSVRIMTVHGAKGLEAPVVILPDTVRTANSVKAERLLWPDRTGSDLPFFCPQTKPVPDICAQAMEDIKERENAEYRRLLYVALTRAEDQLYIGGYKGTKDLSNHCWYNYIRRAFENLPDVNMIEKSLSPSEIIEVQHYSENKEQKASTSLQESASGEKDIELPKWLFERAKPEITDTAPLMPSRLLADETALSPLKSAENNRFLRGNLTHKLLQILPDILAEKRENYAENYLALQNQALPAKLQKSIAGEVMAILNDPDFAPIFGPGSQAEVPVNGYLPEINQVVSGQIDRLIVGQNDILIIDFKTNRPPPKNPQDIPQNYVRQMRLYAQLMQKIYPDRKVRAALIWTHDAQLMEVDLNRI
ncbi:MAG: double-strand break repair helicase AddA [Alphaproteobacteria bacterium]|nr:double-strand break repair helicase AddA [Alphaproteobacteria bacterium]